MEDDTSQGCHLAAESPICSPSHFCLFSHFCMWEESLFLAVYSVSSGLFLSHAPHVPLSPPHSAICLSVSLSLLHPQATPSPPHPVLSLDLTQLLTLFSSWSRQQASSLGASWIELILTRPWGVTSP